MGFWEWAQQGDNLLCLALIAGAVIVAVASIVKTGEL